MFNYLIYLNGINFAKEYGAKRYEIDYHTVVYSELGDIGSGKIKMSYHPSFFRYYGINELGEEIDLIVQKSLANEYETMNWKNDRLYEGLKLITALVLIISFIGLMVSIFKRMHYLGYLLGVILSLIIFSGYGMLNGMTFIILIVFFICIYFVSKSRFIDFNESRNIFNKGRKRM